MFFGDHNPPHVHIGDAGQWAVIAIADGRTLAGSANARLLRQVRAYVEKNKATLMKLWDEYQ
jgi:hypothetical protein